MVEFDMIPCLVLLTFYHYMGGFGLIILWMIVFSLFLFRLIG